MRFWNLVIPSLGCRSESSYRLTEMRGQLNASLWTDEALKTISRTAFHWPAMSCRSDSETS